MPSNNFPAGYVKLALTKDAKESLQAVSFELTGKLQRRVSMSDALRILIALYQNANSTESESDKVA